MYKKKKKKKKKIGGEMEERKKGEVSYRVEEKKKRPSAPSVMWESSKEKLAGFGLDTKKPTSLQATRFSIQSDSSEAWPFRRVVVSSSDGDRLWVYGVPLKKILLLDSLVVIVRP